MKPEEIKQKLESLDSDRAKLKEAYEQSIRSNIGNKIRDVRLQSGLTARKVAERMNVHESVIHRIERSASFSLKTLYRVAEALESDLIIDFRPKDS